MTVYLLLFSIAKIENNFHNVVKNNTNHKYNIIMGNTIKQATIDPEAVHKNNTYNLMLFLLNYDIIGWYDDDLLKLIDVIKKNTKLPTNLLMAKFFEYVVYRKIPEDMICSLLSVGDDQKNKEKITQFIKFIGQKENIIFKKIEPSTYRLADNLQTTILKDLNIDDGDTLHMGLPLPDPQKGRPQLGWLKCMHKDCNKKFPSGGDLVSHLIRNKVYTQGYHRYHADVVARHGLTVERIKEKKMIRCPSLACAETDFKDPDQLIYHFARLGIQPFWKPDMKFDETTTNELDCSLGVIPKIFITNCCPICLENDAQVIINACGHHVYCLDCLRRCDLTRCPICRGTVDRFWPYA